MKKSNKKKVRLAKWMIKALEKGWIPPLIARGELSYQDKDLYNKHKENWTIDYIIDDYFRGR